jgi:hypothetical protein
MSAFANQYPAIMEALGWTLVNSLWQACVLFLVTFIILQAHADPTLPGTVRRCVWRACVDGGELTS